LEKGGGRKKKSKEGEVEDLRVGCNDRFLIIGERKKKKI